MVVFKTTIKRFLSQGEKTGWTYIEVPAEIAQKIKPNTKISYRVKGTLDTAPINALALVPMGEGNFIMPLNATLRKMLRKQKGDTLLVQLEEDKQGYVLNEEFIDCLKDDQEAYAYFQTLTQGHQNYFSKWIDSAKSIETKSSRIVLAIKALARKMGYPEMIRERTAQNKQLKG